MTFLVFQNESETQGAAASIPSRIFRLQNCKKCLTRDEDFQREFES